MKSLRCDDLTVADIREIVTVQEQPLGAYPWTQVDPLGLSEQEREHVVYIQQRLRMMDTSLMNEATIWGRAIYPMLILAEQGPVQAWAQVTLHARYPHVELHGVVDGVLGRGLQSMTETTYYLLVVEAKRGLESQDPRLQLLGQLLAAARLNWELDQSAQQTLFGCYTIIDTWKFVRAVVENLDSSLPTITLEPSREYAQKFEAETILAILKHIVALSVGALVL